MGLSLKIFNEFPSTRPGGNFYTFLACLFIAILFWLLNAFTKTYTTTVELPIQYTEVPSNKVFVKPPPKTIFAEVEGFGFNLLTFSLSTAEDTLQLNTKKLAFSNSSIREHAFVSSNKLLELISGQFSGSIKINKVLLDSLTLDLERKVVKQVPVVSGLNLQFKEQFLLESIEFSPTQIEVSGPTSVLNTLSQVFTDSVSFEDIDQSFQSEIELLIPPNINAEVNKTTCRVNVQRFTEAEKEILISPVNIPENLEVTLVPNSVTITYLVGVSQFKSITEADFEAIVNFKDYENGAPRLLVSLKQIPDGIKLLSVSPKKVEFIIREKGNSL